MWFVVGCGHAGTEALWLQPYGVKLVTLQNWNFGECLLTLPCGLAKSFSKRNWCFERCHGVARKAGIQFRTLNSRKMPQVFEQLCSIWESIIYKAAIRYKLELKEIFLAFSTIRRRCFGWKRCRWGSLYRNWYSFNSKIVVLTAELF